MRVRVTYKSGDLAIDEVVQAADADGIVRLAQQRVAAKTNFLVRLFINSLTPLQFACEVVRRYNEATRSAVPQPRSCQEFIDLAAAAGIATILPEEGKPA